jgi:type IV secretory pathway VirB2 component (pilin)
VKQQKPNQIIHRRFQNFVSTARGAARLGARLAIASAASIITTAPMWAAGGGRLAATQAISNVSTELSGPFAYGASLTMIVASAIYWYRHHHDMGALGNGVLGTIFVGGVAMGAPTVLSMIPGSTGALI